jgi:amino-acid N-acetyltransferase
MTPPPTLERTTIRRATPADLAPVLALVTDARLSVPGVEEHFADFFVAERDGGVIGASGLELRGDAALLRSVVVAPEARGGGVAGALFDAAIAFARDRGVRTIVLLTSSAEGYWARHGFSRIDRADAPEAVKVSAEFNGSCPSSAACMVRAL